MYLFPVQHDRIIIAITRQLTGGSGVSEGKFRIYSYFMQGHDAAECIAFLKNAGIVGVVVLE